MPRDLRSIFGCELLEEPLMRQALTHRSAAAVHNERIEFLGDAVLGLLISRWIYSEYPSFDEGDLTRLRSYLVRKETLARVAKEIDISPLIVVGAGELSGCDGPWRESLLADTLEAVIGALYLLRGIDEAGEFVREIFSDTLAGLPPISSLQDAKTRLQEYLQKKGLALPAYGAVEPVPEGRFRVECTVAELEMRTRGEAASRRKAEQQAAAVMLEKLLVRRGG